MNFNMYELLVDVKRDAINKFDATKDVQPVFNAISTVVHMSMVGRQEGLLALEEMFVYNPAPEEAPVSQMILLVVDGTDPEIIAEVLTNLYWANKYEENEALVQYVLMRGTLLVQEGLNPRIIEEMLKTLLPISLHKACSEHVEEKYTIWKAESDAKIIEWYKNWESIVLKDEFKAKRVQEIEGLVLTLDDRAIQRVLRDIDNSDLVTAISAFSEKGRNLMLKNTSRRLGLMLIEDLLRMYRWYREDDILAAAEKIEKIIRKLESRGEIIVGNIQSESVITPWDFRRNIDCSRRKSHNGNITDDRKK